jgi:demethylmenaquinone methyltransferase/2-methoxy-6-polyprenyl-1,4-benzoquinol methylase
MQLSRDEVWKMFDQISPTYDRVNRILSLGIDQYWRRKVARFLPQGEKLALLDCATGTGDQIVALMERSKRVGSAVGIDLAGEMLRIGRQKLQKKPYGYRVKFEVASALEIPYVDESFDCAAISFGIRNVTDVPHCLKEMQRVLKKNGRLLILEFSLPRYELFKKAHLFYLRTCVPKVGGLISKNQEAYTYLNQTIETFPCGEAFCELMRAAGYVNVQAHPWTFGIATLYSGDRC